MITIKTLQFRSILYKFSHKNATNIKRFYKTVGIKEEKNLNFIESDPNEDKFRNLSKLNKTYYHVVLDGRKCKSTNLDDMKLPRKELALALAAEYSTQKQFVEFSNMKMTTLVSFAIKVSKDPAFKDEIADKLIKYLETDQICFSDSKIDEEILRIKNVDLKEIRQRIFNFLEKKFEINLKSVKELSNYVFEYNQDSYYDESNKLKVKFEEIFKCIDPWVLAILEMITGITKSLNVSLALLNGVISVQESYYVTNFEEIYQQLNEGFVEGYHDVLNEGNLAKIYTSYMLYNL